MDLLKQGTGHAGGSEGGGCSKLVELAGGGVENYSVTCEPAWSRQGLGGHTLRKAGNPGGLLPHQPFWKTRVDRLPPGSSTQNDRRPWAGRPLQPPAFGEMGGSSCCWSRIVTFTLLGSSFLHLKSQEGNSVNRERTKPSASPVNFRGHLSYHKGRVVIAARPLCQPGVFAGEERQR